MKLFNAVFDEDSTKGVYGISLVESPAIMEEWIMLSEHHKEISFSAVDDSKNLLLGAVLIPEQRIYRNMDGNEFEMKFSADTIEKLAHNFQKQSYQNNSSLEHDTALTDVTFVEQWIVEDPNNDKSSVHGKTYPKGTWMAMSKVSDEVYAKAKNGEIKGFSIDGILQLTEVKFKKEVSMNVDLKSISEAISNGFKTLLNEQKEEVKVVAEEVVAEVETPVLEEETFDAEAFKKDLEAVLAQFSASIDSKIEAVKVEFSEAKEVLVKENEDLKVDLAKEPEAEPMKTKPKKEAPKTSEGGLMEFLNNNL